MRLVDSREPWELRELLLKTGWEQQALPTGDFCFDSHDGLKIGATRKKLEDLLNSINDKFPFQLESMLEEYNISIFVFESLPIYSNAEDYIITKIKIEGREIDKVWSITTTQLRNWIHTWQAKRLLYERTYSMDDTAKRLNELYTLWQKPYSLSSKCHYYRDDRVLALCSGLRGKIGQEALESHSIAELCMMGIVQLKELPNFGDKRALSLFNHLHRNGRKGE